MKIDTEAEMEKDQDIFDYAHDMGIEICTMDGMDIYSADDDPIQLSGLYWRKKGGSFRRLPDDMDLEFSQGVKYLAPCTTGANIRFRSNTREIRLHAVIESPYRKCKMTLIGSMGFDLYVGNGLTQVFAKNTTFFYDQDEYTTRIYWSPNPIMRDFTIYFPLYSGVKSVEIGIEKGALLEAPTPWKDPRPIIFYGTSITQGGCVSRPGMLYSNMLSRLLGQPFYNFGFSGNGKGEPQIAEKLAEIADPAMYILDYDGNARPALLEKTLKPFIRILRKKHPKTPILAISAEPKSEEAFEPFLADLASKERPIYSRIHQQVFDELRNSGDDNIYYLDGRMLYSADFDECTVDGCHANDLGSYRIAHALAPMIERILHRWW